MSSHVVRNLLVVAPIGTAQLVIYSALNECPPLCPRELPLLPLDHWIPFWPWTVWAYFLMLVLGVTLPLVVRDRTVFRRLVVAYVISMGTAALFFIFWPTCYPRPPVPINDSWHSAAYRWLVAADTPNCCFPSSHLVPPTLACAALWQDNRRGGVWLPALVGLCTLSILTTKQHYAWDWLGGLAVAAAGFWLAGCAFQSRRDAQASILSRRRDA